MMFHPALESALTLLVLYNGQVYELSQLLLFCFSEVFTFESGPIENTISMDVISECSIPTCTRTYYVNDMCIWVFYFIIVKNVLITLNVFYLILLEQRNKETTLPENVPTIQRLDIVRCYRCLKTHKLHNNGHSI